MINFLQAPRAGQSNPFRLSDPAVASSDVRVFFRADTGKLAQADVQVDAQGEGQGSVDFPADFGSTATAHYQRGRLSSDDIGPFQLT
jgi:hypothetical protein